MTDGRYVFQPVTRLSKTKGRIDVVIKVGSQYVQITTVKKQEIVPGLRLNSTINDIFRLHDLEEANAMIQVDEDSTFGIKAESGKVVMYFASAKKSDILQTIRSAKLKHGRDAKLSKFNDRAVRPEDVPGTLLNICLMNMASFDQELRIASYKLVCALCKAFRFRAGGQFLDSKGKRANLRDPRLFPVLTGQV